MKATDPKALIRYGLAGLAVTVALSWVLFLARDALLLAVHSPLAGMPRLDIGAEDVRALYHGRTGAVQVAGQGRYRCFGPGEVFIGVVDVHAGKMRAGRLVRDVEMPHEAA